MVPGKAFRLEGIQEHIEVPSKCESGRFSMSKWLSGQKDPKPPGTLLLCGIGSLTCHVRVVAVSGEKCKGTLTYKMEKREERRILSS